MAKQNQIPQTKWEKNNQPKAKSAATVGLALNALPQPAESGSILAQAFYLNDSRLTPTLPLNHPSIETSIFTTGNIRSLKGALFLRPNGRWS